MASIKVGRSKEIHGPNTGARKLHTRTHAGVVQCDCVCGTGDTYVIHRRLGISRIIFKITHTYFEFATLLDAVAAGAAGDARGVDGTLRIF